jgi:hypothetical protein
VRFTLSIPYLEGRYPRLTWVPTSVGMARLWMPPTWLYDKALKVRAARGLAKQDRPGVRDAESG